MISTDCKNTPSPEPVLATPGKTQQNEKEVTQSCMRTPNTFVGLVMSDSLQSSSAFSRMFMAIAIIHVSTHAGNQHRIGERVHKASTHSGL